MSFAMWRCERWLCSLEALRPNVSYIHTTQHNKLCRKRNEKRSEKWWWLARLKNINPISESEIKEQCISSRWDLNFQCDIFRTIFQSIPMKKKILCWLSTNATLISMQYWSKRSVWEFIEFFWGYDEWKSKLKCRTERIQDYYKLADSFYFLESRRLLSKTMVMVCLAFFFFFLEGQELLK